MSRCFIHSLECQDLNARRTSQRSPFGDSSRVRKHDLQRHPYLAGTLGDVMMCNPCCQRVRFTREAVRLRFEIMEASSIPEWQFTHPSFTHPDPSDARVKTEGDDAQADFSETVCAICVQQKVFHSDGTAANLIPCPSPNCPLSYHDVCISLAGHTPPGAASAGADCIYCLNLNQLDDTERGRMFSHWQSVQKKLVKRERITRLQPLAAPINPSTSSSLPLAVAEASPTAVASSDPSAAAGSAAAAATASAPRRDSIEVPVYFSSSQGEGVLQLSRAASTNAHWSVSSSSGNAPILSGSEARVSTIGDDGYAAAGALRSITISDSPLVRIKKQTNGSAKDMILGVGGQCQVLAGQLVKLVGSFSKKCLQMVTKVDMDVAVKKPKTNGSKHSGKQRLEWEYLIMEEIRKRDLPNLMQAIGYDETCVQLILPQMKETVWDALCPKTGGRGANVDQSRSPLVRHATLALVRGLRCLHDEVKVSHRDIKPDNLLLRKSHKDEDFGVDDILIADFGYSICQGINHGEKTKYDLPGTLPFTGPEELQARVRRKDATVKLLEEARQLSNEFKGEIEQLIRRHKITERDDHERISDLDAWKMLSQMDSAPIKTLVCGCKQGIGQEMETIDWPALDIYAAAITIWSFFHPNLPAFPDQSHKQVNQDARFLQLLQKKRPSLSKSSSAGLIPELHELWSLVVGREILQQSWDQDVKKRPTAKALQEMMEQAFKEVPPPQPPAAQLVPATGPAPAPARVAVRKRKADALVSSTEGGDEKRAQPDKTTCEHCGKSSSKSNFARHLKKYHPADYARVARIKPEAFTCKICQKVCTSADHLKTHMGKHPETAPTTALTTRASNFVAKLYQPLVMSRNDVPPPGFQRRPGLPPPS